MSCCLAFCEKYDMKVYGNTLALGYEAYCESNNEYIASTARLINFEKPFNNVLFNDLKD